MKNAKLKRNKHLKNILKTLSADWGVDTIPGGNR